MLKPGKTKVGATPTVIQRQGAECGATALAIILGYFGHHIPLEELREIMAVSRNGSTARQIRDTARQFGLEVRAVKRSPEALSKEPFPCIVHTSFVHFLVLEAIDDQRVYVNDPVCGPRDFSREEFNDIYTGLVMSFKPGANFEKRKNRASRKQILSQALFPVRWLVVWAFALNLVAVFCFIGFAIYFGRGFNTAPETPGFDSVLPLASLLVTSWLCLSIRKRFLDRAKERLNRYHSRQLFGLAIKLPASFYTYRHHSGISANLRSGDDLAEAFADFSDPVLMAVAHLPIFLALVLINPLWCFVAVLFSVLHLTAIWQVIGKRFSCWRRVNHAGAVTHGLSATQLYNMEALKIGRRDFDSFAALTGSQAAGISAQQEYGKALAIGKLIPVSFALSILMLAGLAGTWGDNNFSSGEYVTALILITALLSPLRQLLINSPCYHSMLEESRNIFELRALAPKPRDRAQNTALPSGEVRIRDLHFGYIDGNDALLDGISLDIACGQQLGLHGASAIGKSTMACLICGLLDPWSGEIELGEKPVMAKLNVALLNQALLFDASVRDNMTLWGSAISDEEIIAALKSACIWDEVSARGGLSHRISHGGSNFSGGQRIRLSLARILLTKAPIIIIDEVFDGLDRPLEEVILQQLRDAGKTLILISHRGSTLNACDRVFELTQAGLISSTVIQETVPGPGSVSVSSAGHAASTRDKQPGLDVDAMLDVFKQVSPWLPGHVSSPDKSAPNYSQFNSVRDIAAYSGLWLRRVRLRERRWWRKDNGPLIGKPHGKEKAVALLPDGRGYRLEAGSANAQKVDGDLAATLSIDAYMPYRQPQSAKTTLPEMLKRGIVHARRDVMTAMGAQLGVGILWVCIAFLFALMVYPAHSKGDLAAKGAILVLLSVAVLLLSFTSLIAYLRVDGKLALNAHAEVWGRILRLPVVFFRSARNDQILAWSEGLGPILEKAVKVPTTVLVDGFIWLLCGVVLWYFNPVYAVIGLTMMGCLSACKLGLSMLVARSARSSYRLQADNQDLLDYFLHGIFLFRLMAAQQRLTEMWLERSRRQYALNHKYLFSQQVLGSFSIVFPWFAVLLCLALAGPLPLAQLIPFAIVFTLAWQMAEQLTDTFSGVLSVNANIERMTPLLQTPLETALADHQERSLSGAIAVTNVSFQYPNTTRPVLRDVSLQVAAGHVVAVTGPSGSGKSTLLRIILGFDRPDSGQVSFSDHNGNQVDVITARRSMGAVLQDEWLPTATVRAHISGMSPHDLNAVWEVAQSVGLENDIKNWPMGMQTLVDSTTLSSAQVQRIQIARALLDKPKILFLDEATSGLDETSQVNIVNAVRRWGMTCLIISHRKDIASLADRVFSVESGSINS